MGVECDDEDAVEACGRRNEEGVAIAVGREGMFDIVGKEETTKASLVKIL